MSLLILLRHGQSAWNKKNIFTGWVDIPLSLEGIQESLDAGRKIADIPIDEIFTSTLVRAQQTALLAMSVHASGRIPCILHPHEGILEKWAEVYSDAEKKNLIPVHIAWQFNERMYGQLQGLNKAETEQQFGKEQVHAWRRGFHVSPPDGESLAMTSARTLPYFFETVVPCLRNGKNVLISAHGNSLRAVMKHLEGFSDDEISSLELTTGLPCLYRYSQSKGHDAWEKCDLPR